MFDASIPRKNYWSDSVPNKLRCPRCRTKLERAYASYLVAIRIQDGEFESFVMGGPDLGSFCTQCPIVVLDRVKITTQLIGIVEEDSSGENIKFDYAVLGIINLDAIPEDKRGVSIGGDDNPLPLVKFLDTTDPVGVAPAGKRLSGNQRRRLRKLHAA
jgi:hypothetical protein